MSVVIINGTSLSVPGWTLTWLKTGSQVRSLLYFWSWVFKQILCFELILIFFFSSAETDHNASPFIWGRSSSLTVKWATLSISILTLTHFVHFNTFSFSTDRMSLQPTTSVLVFEPPTPSHGFEAKVLLLNLFLNCTSRLGFGSSFVELLGSCLNNSVFNFVCTQIFLSLSRLKPIPLTCSYCWSNAIVWNLETGIKLFFCFFTKKKSLSVVY